VLHFGRFGHIDANAAGLTALVSYRSDRFFGFCAVDISDHHTRAPSRKSDCCCTPDAGGATRHHGNFPRHEI
jgi:hypothetical protein